jgi:hypothetical protein
MAKCALSRPRIRCLGGDAEHAFGASEWEAWHIARDGRETIQGFWSTEDGWLVQQAQYDLAQVHRERIRLKRLAFV